MKKSDKYSSTVIAGSSVISIYETSSLGLQRTFRVKLGSAELGEIALDSWRSPSLSFTEHVVYVWGGLRVFRLRTNHAPERFDFDEEISALYLSNNLIVLVCELSVRLLDNDLKELDRHTSNEVLNAGAWEKDILQIAAESQKVRLAVASDGSKLLKTD
jgi:hypothetical protein